MGTLDPSFCGGGPDINSAYAPPAGLPVLRRLVAQRHLVPENQVVILAGASMALSCSFLAMPADRTVLIPQPGFPAYAGTLRLLNRKIRFYDLGADWMKAVVDAVRERDVGAILLNSPGNPLGNVMADEERQRIIERASQEGVAVILDETYAGLEFPGSGSSGALTGEMAGVIRIGSVSKRHAAPGLRVGYAIADVTTVDRIAGINWLLAMSPGGANQVDAAGLLLKELQEPERTTQTAVALEEACLTAMATLARHGVHPTEPEGGPLLWIELDGAPGTGLDLAAYCREKAGILVSPGDAFGHRGWPAVRCCYAVPTDHVEPVFDRLGSAMASYAGTATDAGNKRVRSS